MENAVIAQNLKEITELLEIKGEKPFRIRAYRRAAETLFSLEENLFDSWIKNQKIKTIPGIGKSIGSKIEELLRSGKIKYLEDLRKETAVRQIVTHYFETKGVDLEELKKSARKRQIVYSRYTKPAKELLELAGSVEAAKQAITKVAQWAKSRKLDYAIETVFKKWLELDRLKPKEIVKKPFYQNDPMIWSETRKRFYVVTKEGEWLEYADSEDKIEWRVID